MPLDLDIDDIIAIGCDHNVRYTAKNRAGTALDNGTATYALIHYAGGFETVVETGDVPYIENDAEDGAVYETVIQSTTTSGLTRRQVYIVRITFVDGDYNDVREDVFKADYQTS